MKDAVASLGHDETRALYEQFLAAREAEMIAEIRRVCGITAADTEPAPTLVSGEDEELAADAAEAEAEDMHCADPHIDWST